MAKKVGKHSAAANDFLEPKPVVITSATDIGTERVLNNGAINIIWTLPAGSPEATLYTITPSPAVSGAPWTTTGLSYLAQGLASDQLYTFSIVASNGAGAAAATVTSAVRSTTKPSAPTSASVASAHPVANQDTVTWSPPTFTGGKAISSYTVVSSDGPSYPNSVSPKAIAETGGTTQSYTIYAVNPNGSSPGTVVGPITTFTPPHFPPFFPPYFPPFFPPFFPPHFPPFFPPYFAAETWGPCTSYQVIQPTCNGEDVYQGIYQGTRRTSSLGNVEVCSGLSFIGFGSCIASNNRSCGGSGPDGPC